MHSDGAGYMNLDSKYFNKSQVKTDADKLPKNITEDSMYKIAAKQGNNDKTTTRAKTTTTTLTRIS